MAIGSWRPSRPAGVENRPMSTNSPCNCQTRQCECHAALGFISVADTRPNWCWWLIAAVAGLGTLYAVTRPGPQSRRRGTRR